MKTITILALLFFIIPETYAVDGLTLRWSDNSSNEAGFNVEVSKDGGEFFEIATTGENEAVFIHTIPDEEKDIEFTYRVRAFNSIGVSGYSNTVTAKRSDFEVPNAPSNPTISINNTTNLNLSLITNL